MIATDIRKISFKYPSSNWGYLLWIKRTPIHRDTQQRLLLLTPKT